MSLRLVRTVADALNASADLDRALRTALDAAARMVGASAAWVWLRDAKSGRYYGAVAQDLPPFLRAPVRMTGRSCWCLRALEKGDLAPGSVDLIECSRLREAANGRERRGTCGLRYHVSVPLHFAGRPLGIMNIATRGPQTLDESTRDLLSVVGAHAGVAIERATLAREGVQAARLEERTRLARQLHDTLAQRLTAIGLHLEAALDVESGGVRAASVQRALDLARGGVDEARESIRSLRGAATRPLVERIESLAHTFTSDTGVRVHVALSALPALPSSIDDELHEIVGEALRNVQKHARAADVDITARVTRRAVTLTIADNGEGFRPSRSHDGFGLIGMRERAAALGGRLRISSSTGRGTRITLVLPVASAEPRAGRT